MRTVVAVMVALLWGCGDSGPSGPIPDGGSACGSNACTAWQTCSAGQCMVTASSQWNLVAANGHVSTQTPRGDAWDALGGAPDPYVCATLNGQRKCTSTKRDTFDATWNEALAMRVGAGALMGGFLVEYVDEDVSANDPICSGNITVTAADFAKGSVGIMCQAPIADSTVTFQLVYSP